MPTVLYGQYEGPEEITPDPTLVKIPRVMVMAGMLVEPKQENTQHAVCFSVIKPKGLYWQYGLQCNLYTRRFNVSDSFAGPSAKKGSWEAGLFGRYFLHGRLTGRRSSFYLGPEIRYGHQNLYKTSNFSNVLVDYTENNFKILVSCGMQFRFDQSVLDLSFPVGINTINNSLDGQTTNLSSMFGIHLGFGL